VRLCVHSGQKVPGQLCWDVIIIITIANDKIQGTKIVLVLDAYYGGKKHKDIDKTRRKYTHVLTVDLSGLFTYEYFFFL
jgi:hypothetical protein